MHPYVKIVSGDGAGLFGGSSTYEGYLDKQVVFTSSQLSTAVKCMFALYHIFGVHYPKKLMKTCTFVSTHIMGLFEPQLPSVQALYNCLSA